MAFELGYFLGQMLAGVVVALLAWVVLLLRRLCRAIELVGRSRAAAEPARADDASPPDQAPRDLEAAARLAEGAASPDKHELRIRARGQ